MVILQRLKVMNLAWNTMKVNDIRCEEESSKLNRFSQRRLSFHLETIRISFGLFLLNKSYDLTYSCTDLVKNQNKLFPYFINISYDLLRKGQAYYLIYKKV
ncbi:Hypothetical predicted protein [Octopus vulgaris]|uniref:Uncharacterized protein n=1 Tax=Octopus vulgaris TaxID=6645 RepID=A0AA36BPF1_OCTVU|nr:Hypothetical predicted protein [Octopus vulgaris]